MKRFVNRHYDLTSDEVMQAIYGWLLANDYPVPSDVANLKTANLDANIRVSFEEVLG